jgi:hypothetical protein
MGATERRLALASHKNATRPIGESGSSDTLQQDKQMLPCLGVSNLTVDNTPRRKSLSAAKPGYWEAGLVALLQRRLKFDRHSNV